MSVDTWLRWEQQLKESAQRKREPVKAPFVSDSFYCGATVLIRKNQPPLSEAAYSTVTDFARLRGWSTSVPLSTAT